MGTPPAAPCLASSREAGLLHRRQAVGTESPTGPPSLALRTPGQASGTSHTVRALVQGALLHLRLPGFSSRPALRFPSRAGCWACPPRTTLWSAGSERLEAVSTFPVPSRRNQSPHLPQNHREATAA